MYSKDPCKHAVMCQNRADTPGSMQLASDQDRSGSGILRSIYMLYFSPCFAAYSIVLQCTFDNITSDPFNDMD